MIQLRHLTINDEVEAYFVEANETSWRRVRVVELLWAGGRRGQTFRFVGVRLVGANPGAKTFYRQLKHLRKVR